MVQTGFFVYGKCDMEKCGNEFFDEQPQIQPIGSVFGMVYFVAWYAV